MVICYTAIENQYYWLQKPNMKMECFSISDNHQHHHLQSAYCVLTLIDKCLTYYLI